VAKPPEVPAEWDPCPRRTRGNIPCGKPRYHTGWCSAKVEVVDDYREYSAHLHALSSTMTITELEAAMNFHLLAYRILRGELNAR
jgi:hypothetical protein